MRVSNYCEHNKEISQDDSYVEHKEEPKEEKKNAFSMNLKVWLVQIQIP